MEGSAACQGELAAEDGSVSIGAVDAHETVDEIVAAHDDEIEKSIAVGIGGMEAVVVQDSGIEAGHGATMEDVPADYGVADVEEDTKAFQHGLIVEGKSMGNGATGADGERG